MKGKRKIIGAAVVVAIALLLVGSGIAQWTRDTGFIFCARFPITQSASDAFKCGNHYFGVYGPAGYDVVKAEYYFGQAIKLDPTLPDVWHQYARIAFLRGDFSTALYRINMQFKERGDELMASYYIRGLIEGYAHDYASAEKDFLKFLAWDPNNWAANNDLAWVYFAQGKYVDVVKRLHGFATTGLSNPWLLTTDAMSLYNLGDKKTAYEELLKARNAASKLSEADWIHAYPGNDPAVAGKGLSAFRKTIEDDIDLVENNNKPR